MPSRSAMIPTLLPAGTVAMAAQTPVGKTRVDAFFRALASGNADAFEAMAKEHLEPEMLARRTPADRTQMVARVKADFGEMTLDTIDRRTDGPVKLRVRGTTGLQGTIELTLGPPPEERISRVGIQIGGDPPDDNAPPPPPVAATMTPVELTAALDRYLEPLVLSGAFSGVVLVARAGVPVYEKAFGLADRAQKTANTPSTRFSLGSINKVFTQTAIAQLVSQGKLEPSDTLGAFLPDYPQAGTRAATIDQHAAHGAAMPPGNGHRRPRERSIAGGARPARRRAASGRAGGRPAGCRAGRGR